MDQDRKDKARQDVTPRMVQCKIGILCVVSKFFVGRLGICGYGVVVIGGQNKTRWKIQDGIVCKFPIGDRGITLYIKKLWLNLLHRIA